ncbi:MAG: J domain-containing protein [Pseudomonadota bacterium]
MPRANERFSPAGACLTPEDYFVLTRVDGRTPIWQLCLISGFSEERTTEVLHKLRGIGAVAFPGDDTEDEGRGGAAAVAAPAAAPLPRGGGVSASVPIDASALAEAVDLPEEQKRSILTKHALLVRGTLFEILGVTPDADKRTLKRAYFKASKDFHPDRFYGRNLGSYGARLDEIFARITEAFEVLDDDSSRAAYLEKLAGRGPTGARPVSARAQSPAEHAAELYDQACQAQVMGDVSTALKLFAAALRQEPQSRHLRRAAEAALSARELSLAEEYARKATEIDSGDALAHRTLAKVWAASGRAVEAKAELEIALKLAPDNDHIAAELEEITKSASIQGLGR